MLTVEVEKVVVTKSAVSLGLVIRYGENGPIRFAQAQLPLGLMTPHTLGLMLAAWDRANMAEDLDDTPALF
jgi:hypothetical protein